MCYVRLCIHFCTFMFSCFSVTNMLFFGLQACVGNYQKITNTHIVTNNPPNFKNKGRNYF